jgi:hypothetical protein
MEWNVPETGEIIEVDERWVVAELQYVKNNDPSCTEMTMT